MNSIVYRSGEQPPARRSAEAAEAELKGPGISIDRQLQLHLDRGTGEPSGKPWTYSSFGRKVAVSKNAVRGWCNGKTITPERFKDIKLELGYGDPQCLSNELDRDLAGKLDEAWTSRYDATQPTSPPLGPSPVSDLFIFPTALPAHLPQRRGVIRQALQIILTAGTNATRTGPLDPLVARWPEHPLEDPQASIDREPVLLFVSLTKALRDCNQPLTAWGAAKPGANAPLRERRQRDCLHIAMLLSALAWTEASWRDDLPNVGQDVRLHQVKSAELLQAGVDAAQGRPFSLPVMQADARNPQRDAAAAWPAVEAWHLACHGAIRAGLGQDREIQLLTALGALFGKALQTPATADAKARQRVLDDFQADLAAHIEVLRLEHDDRSFVLSEQFEFEDDPGVVELHKYAERLNSLAVAHSGQPGSYLRGNERSLLVAINNTLQEINNIPA